MESKKIQHSLTRCPVCASSVEMQRRGLAFHKNPATGRVCTASLTMPSDRGKPVEPSRKTRANSSNNLGAKTYPLKTSAVCKVCKEEHRVTAEGLMSIHSSASHARCPGSPSAEQIQASKRPVKLESASDRAKRQAQRDEQRQQSSKKRKKSKSPRTKYQSEIERAVAEASRKPKGSHSGKMDRKIYAVSGVHFVSGGSPSLKKRR